MRRAYVAIVDLRLGRLPQRCLVTGEPTGNLVRRRRRLGIAGGLAGGALVVTVLAAALELAVLLWVALALAIAAAGMAVAAKLALPGAGYGEHRQTMWLTRVHPDAAIEIDRWMANWIPPATGELAQVRWGVPPAHR
jgi:hypothetical protein